MGRFKNEYESHDHSLEVLNLLHNYDSFLDNLKVIADMGCGSGFDARWWAKLETRDDPPEPRNYKVYAVDQNIKQIESQILIDCPNIVPLERNFEERAIPQQVDLIWSHDSLHLARDPHKCLSVWKQTLNVNGMLVLTVPQTTYSKNNRLMIENHSDSYNFNILSLMYLLAVNGFDTRDAYFYRRPDSPWLYAAVYASEHDPMPKQTTWYELIEKNLVNESVKNSVNRRGYAVIDELVVAWLDKDFYQIRD
jgi:SAM-dependent methyltransferase